VLLAILLACLVDTSASEPRREVPKEYSECMTSDQFEELSRMRFMVGDNFGGTDLGLQWTFADSTELARSGLPPAPDDSTPLVAGTPVAVTAILTPGDTTFRAVAVGRWSAILGTGELPLAIEWLLLRHGWSGNYLFNASPRSMDAWSAVADSVSGRPVTLLVSAGRTSGSLQDGPDGRLASLRRSVARLDSSAVIAADEFDSVDWPDMPDVVRTLRAEAMTGAGRCHDALEDRRVLTAHGLGNPAFTEECSEGYCLLYQQNFEAMADWAFERVKRPPVQADCVANLWEYALDHVIRNRSTIESERAAAFMTLQRSRLDSLGDDLRFAKCREMLVQWDQGSAASGSGRR